MLYNFFVFSFSHTQDIHKKTHTHTTHNHQLLVTVSNHKIKERIHPSELTNSINQANKQTITENSASYKLLFRLMITSAL